MLLKNKNKIKKKAVMLFAQDILRRRNVYLAAVFIKLLLSSKLVYGVVEWLEMRC